MFVLVYTHERELLSQIHSLKSADLWTEGVHMAVKLTEVPGRFNHGFLKVDGLSFIDWRVFLTFGTSLDWTSWFNARHFIRRIRRKYPQNHSMVVGELAGPKAILARCAKEAELSTILVPEGINIFRKQFGGYRWRDLTWKQGFGTRTRYALRVWRERKEKQLSGLSLAFFLCAHLLVAAVQGVLAPRGSKSSSLEEVDLTVSKWSPDVELPVASRTKFHIYSVEKPESLVPPTRPRTAMILQSPEEIESEDWGTILEPLLGRVSTVIIRWHRVNIGREKLKVAVDGLGLAVEIDQDSGPLESREFSQLPEFFIGSRSGALLDLACRYPSAKVVCIADSIKRVAGKRGRQIPGYEETHLLQALKFLSHGRIQFL